MAASGWPLRLAQLPERGRGLVASRDIAAGEVVLAEEPLLLTVAQEAATQACAHCLRWLAAVPGGGSVCSTCHQAAFCSAECAAAAAAKPWVHAEATCRAYAAIPALLPGEIEAQGALRFLVQAVGLKAAAASGVPPPVAPLLGVLLGGVVAAPSGYDALMTLVGAPTQETLAAAAALQPALAGAIGADAASLLPVQEAASLLAKERLNSYGLLAPPECSLAGAGSGGRGLRGSGLYAAASLVNHECLPNVARFDALDAPEDPGCGCTGSQHQSEAQHVAPPPADGSAPAGWPRAISRAALVLRALHGLPAGTEVLQSYVPLSWSLTERQDQTERVYGFTCTCPRCVLESSTAWQDGLTGSSSGWETDDDQGSGGNSDGDCADGGGSADAAMDDAHGPSQSPPDAVAQLTGPPGQPEVDGGYLAVFMLKFVCSASGCGGTMAALPPGCIGGEGTECSVCGAIRSEADFLAELENT